MRRLWALVLILGAGCASSDHESLAEDGWWGDLRSAFGSENHDSIRIPRMPDRYASPPAPQPTPPPPAPPPSKSWADLPGA